MKGIILAGGSGISLYPITKGIPKLMLPIYNKPMIYYPLSILMMTGITEILIISTPDDQETYQRLLGNGYDFGLSFHYIAQPSPDGWAQAFILSREFIGDDAICLTLGDNIFYGHALKKILPTTLAHVENSNLATVFGYRVTDPERFGVAELDDKGNVVSLEEKPKQPKSNYAVTGLYFYPNDVVKKVTTIISSACKHHPERAAICRMLKKSEICLSNTHYSTSSLEFKMMG